MNWEREEDTNIHTIAGPIIAEMGSMHSPNESLGVMVDRATPVFFSLIL